MLELCGAADQIALQNPVEPDMQPSSQVEFKVSSDVLLTQTVLDEMFRQLQGFEMEFDVRQLDEMKAAQAGGRQHFEDFLKKYEKFKAKKLSDIEQVEGVLRERVEL